MVESCIFIFSFPTHFFTTPQLQTNVNIYFFFQFGTRWNMGNFCPSTRSAFLFGFRNAYSAQKKQHISCIYPFTARQIFKRRKNREGTSSNWTVCGGPDKTTTHNRGRRQCYSTMPGQERTGLSQEREGQPQIKRTVRRSSIFPTPWRPCP